MKFIIYLIFKILSNIVSGIFTLFFGKEVHRLPFVINVIEKKIKIDRYDIVICSNMQSEESIAHIINRVLHFHEVKILVSFSRKTYLIYLLPSK